MLYWIDGGWLYVDSFSLYRTYLVGEESRNKSTLDQICFGLRFKGASGAQIESNHIVMKNEGERVSG